MRAGALQSPAATQYPRFFAPGVCAANTVPAPGRAGRAASGAAGDDFRARNDESALLRARRQLGGPARRDHRREPAPDRGTLRRPRRAGGAVPGLPGHLPATLEHYHRARQVAPAPGHRAGRPGRHLGPQPLRVGRHAVRHRPRRRDSRQREPRLPGTRAAARVEPVGPAAPAAVAGIPRSRLRGDRRAGPTRVPGAGRDGSARRRLGGAPRGGRARRGRRARRARGQPHVRRPHQHPVHLGHHRHPEGRHPVAPQHPEQRLLLRRDPGLHRA